MKKGRSPGFCSAFFFMLPRYNRALTVTRSILKKGQELSGMSTYFPVMDPVDTVVELAAITP